MSNTVSIPSPAAPTSDRGGLRLALRVTQRVALDAGETTEQVSEPVVTVSEHLDVAVDYAGVVLEVCDYSRFRVYKFPEAGKVLDGALMAELHHRQAERFNRESVAQRLRDQGKDPVDSGMSAGLVRHALSLGESGDSDELKWDAGTARIDGQVVYARSDEAWPADEAAMQDVSRFLRRAYRGHPAIMLEMAAKGGVPKRMMLRFRYPGRTDECLIEVLDAQPVAAPTYSLDGLAWTSAGLPVIAEQVAIAMPFGEAGKAELDQFDAQLRALIGDKQWLAGLLTVFELSWTLQGVPQNFMEALQRLPQEGRTAYRVMKITQKTPDIAKDEAKLQSTIDELKSCAKEAGPKAYCLDVLIGNLYQAANKHERAIEAYMRATRANPGMCVVYHNMGNSLAHIYQFHAAYQCWDFAYFIAPGHPAMNDVQAAQLKVREDELQVPIGRMLS